MKIRIRYNAVPAWLGLAEGPAGDIALRETNKKEVRIGMENTYENFERSEEKPPGDCIVDLQRIARTCRVVVAVSSKTKDDLFCTVST